MKTKIRFSFLSIIFLISYAHAHAQEVIYMPGKPTSSIEHHQAKDRVPKLKVGVPMEVRPYVPEWDAKTDQVIYTIEPLSDNLTAVPHPTKKGWWVLTATGGEKRVKFRYFAHAKKDIVYKIAVLKGTNRVAEPREDGTFDKSKITWSSSVIGKKRIHIDDYVFYLVQ